jgi:hypothetical protein
VALGFVEGLNNKIRVLQRRAYGLRDEEYLRLKILTTMLPDPPVPRSAENDPHESPKTLYSRHPWGRRSDPGSPSDALSIHDHRMRETSELLLRHRVSGECLPGLGSSYKIQDQPRKAWGIGTRSQPVAWDGPTIGRPGLRSLG